MSSCYCDYDAPTVHNSGIRKARKPHHCYECGGRIDVGERYEHTFGVWDGTASSFKTCERCRDIRVWVFNNVPCFCWAHGNMLDDAAETINDAYDRAPKEVVGLRFGFLRRKVLLTRHNNARRALAA